VNILVINHYAGSHTHGMDLRPFCLSRHWCNLGHDVTVVAASYSHLRVRQPCLETGTSEERIEGIRYVWLKAPRYRGNGPGRVWNLFAFLRRLRRSRKQILRNWRPDVVIAASTYLLDVYPARRIARDSKAALILEVRDLWPMTPIEIGGMSKWHPFMLLLQRAEKYAYRTADRVVSTLPEANRHMQRLGMAPEKFAFVPNGIDVEAWEARQEPLPGEHARTLRALRRQGRFILGYAGAHGVSNALGTLVEAARLLQPRPVSVALVGQGPEKPALMEQARGLDPSSIVFLPAVGRAAVPAFLAAADAAYLGWKRRPIYQYGISPTKLLDYMMAGKPVVHSVEAGNDPVAEAGCGLSCAAEDPQAVAGAVVTLMSMTPQDRAELGRRGQDYVRSRHDYALLARNYLDVMGEATTSGTRSTVACT